ncbi:sulfotransferase family protein [Microbulbifer sp. SA54]|uniref:sulfotransferase family protein n=1 Tax=Microbulbifer sp. SA54 TaxID=3401577 RepID=UPI003AACDC02
MFIIGYKRSGTTLLRLILNRSSGIFIPEESSYIQRIPVVLKKNYSNVKCLEELASSIPGSLYHPYIDWELYKSTLSQNLPATHDKIIGALYQTYAALSGKENARWGDKKPQHWQFIYRLREWYPDSQYIHIVRNPNDTVASIIQYTANNDTKLTQHEFVYKIPGVPPHIILAWHISHAYKTSCTQGETLGSKRYLQVRYEDLAQAPREEMLQVCRFLNVDTNEIDYMLGFQEDAANSRIMGSGDANSAHMKETRKAVNSSRVGRHKTLLTADQAGEVEFICRRLYREMRYEATSATPSLLAKLKCRIICNLLDIVWVGVRVSRRLRGSL